MARKTNNRRKLAGKPSDNNKIAIVAGAVGLGALVAILNGSGGAHNTDTVIPAPTPGTTPQPGGNVQTRPNPTPAPTPTPAPAPVTPPAQTKPVYRPAPTLEQYVFVDSFNGEGIYAGTGSSNQLSYGYGRGRIIHLSNGCFVGKFTGKVENHMLEIWMKANYKGADREVNFWIAEDEVIIKHGKAEYDKHIAGIGNAKPTEVINEIMKYFFG